MRTKRVPKLNNGAKYAAIFLAPFVILYMVFGLFPIVYSFLSV